MSKDFYEVLGVSKNATQEEIKKAYRNLARAHHPDMVKDSDKKAAEVRFKEINEAYQVLSDPQKRRMYDQYGHTGAGFGANGGGFGGFGDFSGFARGGQKGPFTYTYTSSGENPFGGFEDFDPFDIFESFFGSRGFSSRSPKKGKNLYYELNITFKEALFGVEKSVKIESGNVTIKIPAGIRSGMEVKFVGKGMPGPNGAPNGDLFITVKYPSPKEFEIVHENIVINLQLDFITAVLGGETAVLVIDLKSATGLGTAKVKIPAGTQHGTRFLLRGKGMPRLRGSGQGDVLIVISVVMPKNLSRKQKQLLEEYRNL